MSVYSPVYGVTEALETEVIRSKIMLRFNAKDIIIALLNRPGTSVVDAEFVEFHDSGDLIFRATLIKPVESK